MGEGGRLEKLRIREKLKKNLPYGITASNSVEVEAELGNYLELPIKCYDYFQTSDKVKLNVLWEKHSWSKYIEDEELDKCAGPRYCRNCEFQAGDGYNLDSPFLSEHDDYENDSRTCNFCDEIIPTVNYLMMHKKKDIDKLELS